MSGQAAQVEQAKFYTKAQGGNPVLVEVEFFNPVSLQYSVANTLAQQSEGKQQYVSQSTAKLTMDLVFDSTDTGTDVRLRTGKIAALMKPGGAEGDKQRTVPDVVLFEWGTFSFQGMVEAYKETIDFFAPEGVPLRASVNLTLSRQDMVFEPDPRAGTKTHEQPRDVPLGGGQGLAGLGLSIGLSIGSSGGASAADMMRRIAAANRLEDPRHVGAETVTIAASLLSGKRGASGNGGAASNGFGGNGTNGFGISAGAAGGASSVRVGGLLSAGVAASQGAFAGLRAATANTASARVDLDRLAPQQRGRAISTGAGAQFRLGGRAEMEAGGADFRADVGAEASLSSELVFDE